MAVQRWRLTFARDEVMAGRSQRDLDRAWDDALAPFRTNDGAVQERPRIVVGAPLPVGMSAGRELADLLVPERRRLPDVRAALEANLPADHRLVDLHDVWVGEPALPGLLVAGDYRVAIEADRETNHGLINPFEGIDAAVRALLDATALPRARTRGERTPTGNLRPLIVDVAVEDAGVTAPPFREVWMRLRFHPSQGTGRPDEVVAALGAILGHPLKALRRHRERLWLRGELPE